MDIPFNRPFMTGNEVTYILQAHASRHLAGNGSFTKRCHSWLQDTLGVRKCLLTTSCTSALEMAAILSDVKPGDEVLMPSFTFVSTATAFVLRGAIPVFVDINPTTLSLDESRLIRSITKRTKAVVPVHYAGACCDMDSLLLVAREHNLLVVEDAAQALLSTHRTRCLGSLGHMAALSFHETKNVMCGEGGALLINDETFAERAEIIWEKGTNRSKFFRGEVDKYTWVDLGSSFLPSELVAAFLYAQLEQAFTLTRKRLSLWRAYHRAFENLEHAGYVRRPDIPSHCQHNGHIYYLLTRAAEDQQRLIAHLNRSGINAVFHYVPLHQSPGGLKYARTSGAMNVTEDVSSRLVRLPLWPDMSTNDVDNVVGAVLRYYGINDLSIRSAA